MASRRVLVVDDEQGMLEVCADTINGLRDTEVTVEGDPRRATELLANGSFDLLILDIRMPEMDGLELLRLARQQDPNLIVLMLTAYPTVETAVESMKHGAADYLVKPFIPDDLRATVRRLLDERQLRDENRLLRRQLERSYSFGEILGQSAPMRRVFDTISRVAASNADVLILGETGTGKELIARAIHQRSSRSKERFVPVDCGAIPDELIESEFFGYERGAFTGAVTRNLGLMEFAHKGSLFLDEICELPPRLQAKFLRVLQERAIRRVGGREEVAVDIRIIAATSRDLELEVREKRFRLDLYYRINVVRVELPPLRQRGDDIALLTRHFVSLYAAELGTGEVSIDPEVVDVLSSYSWPGNVRELQNIIKRTLAMARTRDISVDDLPDEIVAAAGNQAGPSAGGFFAARSRQMTEFEKDYLDGLLADCSGDVAEAARKAQMPRGTLYRLIKNHNLQPSDYRTGAGAPVER